jgi:hypothetical protein
MQVDEVIAADRLTGLHSAIPLVFFDEQLKRTSDVIASDAKQVAKLGIANEGATSFEQSRLASDGQLYGDRFLIHASQVERGRHIVVTAH